jgi:hypothetical protein
MTKVHFKMHAASSGGWNDHAAAMIEMFTDAGVTFKKH